MDMVTVPKRIVDLLTQIQKYGTIARASELQEVYRLIAAHNAGANGGKKSCAVQDECAWPVCRRGELLHDAVASQFEDCPAIPSSRAEGADGHTSQLFRNDREVSRSRSAGVGTPHRREGQRPAHQRGMTCN